VIYSNLTKSDQEALNRYIPNIIFDSNTDQSLLKKTVVLRLEKNNNIYFLCLDILVYTSNQKDFELLSNFTNGDLRNFDNIHFYSWFNQLLEKVNLNFEVFNVKFTSAFTNEYIHIICLPRYLCQADAYSDMQIIS